MELKEKQLNNTNNKSDVIKLNLLVISFIFQVQKEK